MRLVKPCTARRSMMKLIVSLLAMALLMALPSVSATRQTLTTNTGVLNGFCAYDYMIPNGGSHIATGKDQTTAIMPLSGTIHNLSTNLNVPPDSGESRVYQLMKNGDDTELKCTIPSGGTSCSNATASVDYAIGDNITMKIKAVGTPTFPQDCPNQTNSYFSLVFETDEDDEFVLFGNGYTNLQTYYQSLHGSNGADPAKAHVETMIPDTFNIEDFYVNAGSLHNATQQTNFTVLVNGTIPIITCTIGNNEQNCTNTTESYPLYRWYDLAINVSKNDTDNIYYIFSTKFTSPDAGMFFLAQSTDDTLPSPFAGNPLYTKIAHGDGGLGTALFPSYEKSNSNNITGKHIVVRQDLGSSVTDKNYTVMYDNVATDLLCQTSTSPYIECEDDGSFDFINGVFNWKVNYISPGFAAISGFRSSVLFDDNQDYADTDAPSITLYSPANDSETNNALNYFQANLTDATALNYSILYVWNSTGVLNGTNETEITGTDNDTNLSFTFSAYDYYSWNYWANDSLGYSGFADDNFTINYTAPSEDTCTYPGSSWNILCSDNCTADTNIDVQGNNITIYSDGNPGYFTMNANITNVDRVEINSCSIYLNNGGFDFA